MKVIIKDGKVYNLAQMVSCEVRENITSIGEPILDKEKDIITYTTRVQGWKLIYKFSNGEEVNVFVEGDVKREVTKQISNDVLDMKKPSEIINVKFFVDGEEVDIELLYQIALEKEKRVIERNISLKGKHIIEI